MNLPGEAVDAWSLDATRELVLVVERFAFRDRVRVYLEDENGTHGPLLEAEL